MWAAYLQHADPALETSEVVTELCAANEELRVALSLTRNLCANTGASPFAADRDKFPRELLSVMDAHVLHASGLRAALHGYRVGAARFEELSEDVPPASALLERLHGAEHLLLGRRTVNMYERVGFEAQGPRPCLYA
jgi:hypothetical protein